MTINDHGCIAPRRRQQHTWTQ